MIVLFFFLSCFDLKRSTLEDLEFPSCLNATEKKILPQWRPNDFFSKTFEDGSIILMAEHHEQVVQIENLSRAIELASQKNQNMYFAAEWLSQSSTNQLNTLVNNQQWNQEIWNSIIENKYYIRPLHISEYELPIKKIWYLNQHRKSPIKIFGLAPTCSFENLSRKDVIRCLMEREKFMEEQVRKNFLPSQKGLLFVGLGFRHAQLTATDIEHNIPLGARLSDYNLTSILLNGFGLKGLSLCNGIFDHLKTEIIVSPNDLGIPLLNTSCVSTDPYHNIIPLHEAYSHIWIGPYDWKKGTYLSKDTINNMRPQTLSNWSIFQHSLMQGPNLGHNSMDWSKWIESNFSQLNPQEQNHFDCSQMSFIGK